MVEKINMNREVLSSLLETTQQKGEGEKDYFFKTRLDALIEACGGVSALADAAEVSRGVLRKWLKGESEPTRDRLLALANVTGVRAGWLVAGEGPVFQDESSIYSNGNKNYFVKYFEPLPDMSKNEKNFLEQKEGELIPIPKRWMLTHQLNVIRRVASDNKKKDLFETAKNSLFLTRVPDDSMEPTLLRRDIIMIDVSWKEVSLPGLYGIVINNNFTIKRIQPSPNMCIHVMADNQAYQSFFFKISEIPSDIKVIGRVIWFGRELY